MRINEIQVGTAYQFSLNTVCIVIAVGKYARTLADANLTVKAPLVDFPITKGVSPWYGEFPSLAQRRVVTLTINSVGHQSIDILTARELKRPLDPEDVKAFLTKSVSRGTLQDAVDVVVEQEDVINQRLVALLTEINGLGESRSSRYYGNPFSILLEGSTLASMVALWLQYQTLQEPQTTPYNPDEMLEEFQDLVKSLKTVDTVKRQAQNTSGIVAANELKFDEVIANFTQSLVRVA